MLAAAFEAGDEPQKSSSASKPGRRRDADELRLAFGQRAGLVDHKRVDLLHQFERFGIAHEHAGARAAAGADHDRHRRGQTRAHRGRR